MQYTPREPDPIANLLEPLVHGMGMSLVELSVSRTKSAKSKGSGKKDSAKKGEMKESSRVQIRLVVYKPGVIGIDDCSRLHHAILPRLELAFPKNELYVEVSSPGIARLIKDGSEFSHYIGRGIRCYHIEVSDWICGILQSANTGGIVLKTQEGMTELTYSSIGKAKLDYSQED